MTYLDNSTEIPAFPVTIKCHNKLQQRTQTIMKMCKKGAETYKNATKKIQKKRVKMKLTDDT